jgi:hypothetical protein
MMRWRLSSPAALTVRAYGLDTLGTGRSGIMFGRLRRLRHRLRLPLRSVIERYNLNFTFLILSDRAIDAIAKTKFIDQGNYMVVLLEGHLDVAHRRLSLFELKEANKINIIISSLIPPHPTKYFLEQDHPRIDFRFRYYLLFF